MDSENLKCMASFSIDINKIKKIMDECEYGTIEEAIEGELRWSESSGIVVKDLAIRERPYSFLAMEIEKLIQFMSNSHKKDISDEKAQEIARKIAYHLFVYDTISCIVEYELEKI